MLHAIIGYSGTIGSSLCDHWEFDLRLGSGDLNRLVPVDLLVIAAPSGNRLAVNRGLTQDRQHCEQILAAVRSALPEKLVLISSVDAVTAPDSIYGSNRRWLESELADAAPTAVLRLPTLIGSRIKKNILYDIRHNQFLDQVDAGAWLQWYILDDLPDHIRSAEPGQARDLVSVPIENRSVLARYLPGQEFSARPVSLHYNQQPWLYTQDQIFSAMDRYIA